MNWNRLACIRFVLMFPLQDVQDPLIHSHAFVHFFPSQARCADGTCAADAFSCPGGSGSSSGSASKAGSSATAAGAATGTGSSASAAAAVPVEAPRPNIAPSLTLAPGVGAVVEVKRGLTYLMCAQGQAPQPNAPCEPGEI